MAGYNNIDQAVTLPFNNALTGAQKASILQNEQQLNEQKKYRLERQQERDDAKRGQFLNSEVNRLSGLHIDHMQKFNDWTNGKLQDLIDKFTTDPQFANLPPADFEASLQREALPIIQGYNAVSGKVQRETDNINQISTQKKWVDKNALTNDVWQQIAGNAFTQDAQGKITFKPIQSVDWETPIAPSLINSEDAYKYINDAAIDDFKKNITDAKGTPFTGIWMDANGGSRTYTGKLSPFQKADVLPNEKGFINANPTFSIATEGKTDEQGNPINTIPEDVINSHMANTEGRKKAMQYLFHQNAAMQGIDLSKLNSQQLDNEVKKFAYTAAKNSVDNQPELHSYERPPRISNTTNVNIPKDIGINDVYNEVNSKVNSSPNENGALQFNKLSSAAQGVILDQVNKVSAKDEDESGAPRKFTNADIFIRKDKDGNMNVYRADNGQLIMPLDQTNLNLSVNKNQKQQQIILHNQNNSTKVQKPAKDPLGIF